MLKKQGKILTLAIIAFTFTLSHAMPAGSRITLPSGKKIFVSGMNLAWNIYAGDVGDTPLSTTYFNTAFKAVKDSGGNCMRVWLSTDGTNDPKYGSDGLVKGPGTQTVVNIQKMLKIAKDNNILLMPVLLTHNWVNKDINPTILANNNKMLKTEAGLQAYIDNYLIPVVTAVGFNPNLLCWEIFNEPEGMVQGWSSPANTITKKEVQRAVNWIASAIRTAVPQVLVSNGAVSIGNVSWYTDAALKAEGGKANGYLDFYMAHYYGWNGVSNSPFTKGYAAWSFDKPLVIGEYASSSWSPTTNATSTLQDAAMVDTLLTYLNKAGYAGGLGWQYQPDHGDPWMKGFATFGHSIAEAYRADSNSIKLDGVVENTFAVLASAGNGGTVTASVNGRVEAGKPVTLTATAAAGFTFAGWTGDTAATVPVLVLSNVTKDWIITANFIPNAGTNLIRGGDFSDATLWGFYAATGTAATVGFAGGVAAVSVTKSDSLDYHIQLSQGSIVLDSGVTYVLSFDAWSTGNRLLYAGLSTAVTWHYHDGADVSLTDKKATYSVELNADSSTTAGILQFNIGFGSLLPVYIDNVQMVKKVKTATVAAAGAFVAPLVSFTHQTDDICWSAPLATATASLIDLQGRVVLAAITKRVVSVRSVPAGAYLFVVKSEVGSKVFRFIR